MDFNVKKLVKEAGTAFNRVVQLTEEKFGTSGKTELDAHFEHLAERSDATKLWTEKILSNTEAVLTPNIGNRVEDFLFDKIEKKKPNRLSNLEYLGIDMIEAGNDFGAGTAYGSALIKVGQCEKTLGQTERDFITSAHNCFVVPLRKFLDGEMRTIQKERSLLECRRLDLDACKSKLRKARSMQSMQTKDGPNPEVLVEQAERDLRVAQSEFDRQAEITKLLLEGVHSSHANHLRCLHEFVESQVRYYSKCHQIMQDLQRDLASLSLVTIGGAPYQPLSLSPDQEKTTNYSEYPPRKALVRFDYSAKDSTELSVLTDEVALSDWADQNKFSLKKKWDKINARQKKVLSKTFHGAGIVVPVDAETKLGYRPLLETDANLKKICKLIIKASDEKEKESLWENLQPLITAANIANDECDFGNSLELGINLFCMGSAVFHNTIEHLLSTAYFLLNRAEFAQIIKTHLKFRRKGDDMSVRNLNLNQVLK